MSLPNLSYVYSALSKIRLLKLPDIEELLKKEDTIKIVEVEINNNKNLGFEYSYIIRGSCRKFFSIISYLVWNAIISNKYYTIKYSKNKFNTTNNKSKVIFMLMIKDNLYRITINSKEYSIKFFVEIIDCNINISLIIFLKFNKYK